MVDVANVFKQYYKKLSTIGTISPSISYQILEYLIIKNLSWIFPDNKKVKKELEKIIQCNCLLLNNHYTYYKPLKAASYNTNIFGLGTGGVNISTETGDVQSLLDTLREEILQSTAVTVDNIAFNNYSILQGGSPVGQVIMQDTTSVLFLGPLQGIQDKYLLSMEEYSEILHCSIVKKTANGAISYNSDEINVTVGTVANPDRWKIEYNSNNSLASRDQIYIKVIANKNN